MRVVRVALLSCGLAALAAAGAAAQDAGGARRLETPPPVISSLSNEIALLRIVGPWQAEGKKGFIRVVGTTSGGRLTLYAQWITQSGEVFATAEIPEAAEKPELALGDIRVEAGDPESSVYFDTLPDAQGFRETFVLMLGFPGEARFGPATN